jgi:hypothetical protein
MNDNHQSINEHTEDFYHGNFVDTPVMDNSLDPNFGEKMSFERNDSLKPFCTYEASAFKSTPRSNKLSISPNSNVIGELGTPVESMKVVTGFVPKSKNNSSMFNSPGTNMIEEMKNNINGLYQQPSSHYYIPNPTIVNSVSPEHSQTNVFSHTQQPLDPIPESSSKKSKQSTESADGKSMKEDSPEAVETDKKEKNRVSAQKCRKRKKQYVESLELKIKELEEELVKCKEEIKKLKEAQSANLIAESNANEYQAKYKELISALNRAMDARQSDEILKQLIGELNVLYIILTT